MARVSTEISKGYRYFFYSLLTLSFLTGMGFWFMRHYFMVEGDFGPEAHFLQFPLLQLHGFAAFFMLMALGAIFSAHIPKTWSTKRAKKTGLGFLIAVSFSIVSAYSLYYLVSQEWHELLGNAHAVVGIMLPSLLAFHIIVARKSRLNKKTLKYEKRRQHKQKRLKEKQLKIARKAKGENQADGDTLTAITVLNANHENVETINALEEGAAREA